MGNYSWFLYVFHFIKVANVFCFNAIKDQVKFCVKNKKTLKIT